MTKYGVILADPEGMLCRVIQESEHTFTVQLARDASAPRVWIAKSEFWILSEF